jgi:hypothetical protein
MAGYLGNIPSAVPLTSADIADGIISSAKIADGTIVNADINASAGIDSTKISGLSSDFVLLATTDASSSASVSFDGYFSATYKNYLVLVANAIPATNDISFRFRLRRSNADVTTANYNNTKWSYFQTSSGSGNIQSGAWDADHVNLVYAGVRNTTSYGGANFTCYIMNPLGTASYKAIIGTNTYYHDNSAVLSIDRNDFTAVLDDATTALSGITFYFGSGNITSGNFKLYGIK